MRGKADSSREETESFENIQYGAFMVAPKGNALSHHVYRFLSVNNYFFIIYNMPSLK